MADQRLNFLLAARDNASATIRRTRGELTALGGSGTKAAGPLGRLSAVTGGLVSPMTLAFGGAAALTAGLAGATNAALEEERGIAALTAALKANDPAALRNIDRINQTITERQNLAFADDQQRESLAGLISVTKDETAALDLQRTAMDLARLKGMDLATASNLIGKVYAGNLGILSRYGIILDKDATSTEALAEIQRRAQGQAEEYANTTSGALESMNLTIGDVVEEVGAKLTPTIRDFAITVRDDVVPVLLDMTRLLDLANKNSADGIPILQEAEDVLNGIADAGLEFSDFLRLQSGDVTEWAERTGQAYGDAREDLKDYADQYGVSFGEAADALAANETLVTDALDRLTAKGREWHTRFGEDAAGAAADFDAATDEIVKDAGETPGEMAKAIEEGREAWKDSWQEMKEAAKYELNETRVNARLLSRLTSQELFDGLRSKDKETRLWAQQTRDDIMTALDINGYDLGGMLVNGFVLGITENQWRMQSAAAGFAQVFRDEMPGSEPKSPTSPFRGITHWGGDIVQMIADDMVDRARRLRFTEPIAASLSEMTRSLAGPELAGSAPGGSAGTGGGGITINFYSTYPPSRSGMEQIARDIFEPLERERRRNRVN